MAQSGWIPSSGETRGLELVDLVTEKQNNIRLKKRNSTLEQE